MSGLNGAKEKFKLKSGKPWKVAGQIEYIQKAFCKARDMWLDNYFKPIMPTQVYEALMARKDLAATWMFENGYMWHPSKLGHPYKELVVMFFELRHKGQVVSTFDFNIETDGTFNPVWVAKKIYNMEKGGIIIPDESNFKNI